MNKTITLTDLVAILTLLSTVFSIGVTLALAAARPAPNPIPWDLLSLTGDVLEVKEPHVVVAPLDVAGSRQVKGHLIGWLVDGDRGVAFVRVDEDAADVSEHIYKLGQVAAPRS